MKTNKVSLSLKRLFIRGRSLGLRPFKKVPSPFPSKGGGGGEVNKKP